MSGESKKNQKSRLRHNENTLENISMDAVSKYLTPAVGLDADAIISSNDIINYELLKKAFGNHQNSKNLIEKYERESGYYLISAMSMLNKDPEMALRVGGRNMESARKLAQLLKNRVITKELQQKLDKQGDIIHYALKGKNLTDIDTVPQEFRKNFSSTDIAMTEILNYAIE